MILGKIRKIFTKSHRIRTIFGENRKILEKTAVIPPLAGPSLEFTECFDRVPRVASLAQKRFRAGKNKCARMTALHTPAGDGHPPGARRRPYLPRINVSHSPSTGLYITIGLRRAAGRGLCGIRGRARAPPARAGDSGGVLEFLIYFPCPQRCLQCVCRFGALSSKGFSPWCPTGAPLVPYLSVAPRWHQGGTKVISLTGIWHQSDRRIAESYVGRGK